MQALLYICCQYYLHNNSHSVAQKWAYAWMALEIRDEVGNENSCCETTREVVSGTAC